ncbi:hypothetical protein [Rhodovulum marinum]|uniref:VanZ like protein n=1 Tax=Rhodovulum marinum TaxID=320662 RepID=A0A4R2PTU8_9RHOB|nr:hypothetical protein [Rhodovulum marinum]TCP39277.1 hypothetical protein EV662_11354 [Rhodovulum marinum]
MAAGRGAPWSPSARRRIAAVSALGLFAAICWLSLTDDLPDLVRRAVEGYQVPAHGAMHMALAVLVYAALPRRRDAAAGVLLAVAVLLELAQGMTATREVWLSDMAANVAGSLAGIALFAAVSSRCAPR